MVLSEGRLFLLLAGVFAIHDRVAKNDWTEQGFG